MKDRDEPEGVGQTRCSECWTQLTAEEKDAVRDKVGKTCDACYAAWNARLVCCAAWNARLERRRIVVEARRRIESIAPGPPRTFGTYPNASGVKLNPDGTTAKGRPYLIDTPGVAYLTRGDDGDLVMGCLNCGFEATIPRGPDGVRGYPEMVWQDEFVRNHRGCRREAPAKPEGPSNVTFRGDQDPPISARLAAERERVAQGLEAAGIPRACPEPLLGADVRAAAPDVDFHGSARLFDEADVVIGEDGRVVKDRSGEFRPGACLKIDAFQVLTLGMRLAARPVSMRHLRNLDHERREG